MPAEIYLDNASTSYPKPLILAEAIETYLVDAGCSPGRSGHARARKSEEIVDNARRSLATLLGCKEYLNIAFTYNATYALNFAIKGILKQGDHVITTCMEHNSVLRPLEKLKRQGIIEYSVIGLDVDGMLNLQEYEQAFRDNTALVVINHASNVTGIVNPIELMIPHAHDKGAKVLVDASQTVGFLDIAIDGLSVDFLAFTGHKSLLGLPGLGGLYIKDADDLETTIEGGTGGNSFSLVQPGSLPEKFEAGTCNYTGIAALGAGIKYITSEGIEKTRQRERALLSYLTGELATVQDVVLYGVVETTHKVPVLSFNITGIPANEVSTVLDSTYSIMTRPGLQCAPLIHKALGTHPIGTVRVSLGMHTTESECDNLVEAVKAIIQGKRASQ